MTTPQAPDEVADALARDGIAIAGDFLAPDLVCSLASEARAAIADGRFHAAGVGSGQARTLRPDIRGDHILWLERPQTDAQRDYFARMEALRLAINERLFLGLFDLECHFALYRPGSRYQRHLDRFRGDARRAVSVVLYLNTSWDPAWGGALRVYESEAPQAPFRDIVPLGGTLVCFLSDSVSHEVQPTERERLSLTGWLRRRG